MSTCPAGHQTVQTDFCDTCGLPIAGGTPDGVPAAAPTPAAAPVICPSCHAANVADALFCEACGYDFTTSMPAEAVAGPEQTPADVGPEPAAHLAPVAADDPEAVVPSVAEQPAAEQVVEEQPATEQPAEDQPAAEQPLPAEPATEQPETEQSVAEQPATEQPVAPASVDPAPGAVLPPRPAVEWVAELWIDPDWYAAQGSTDPMPSPGLPDIVPLAKQTSLVGRVSHSRGIFPDVDCELDSGVSRRHAMLSTDGSRWWIEDLSSANGTFVGASAGPLPAMPIPQGRVEFSLGQRIYLGAWTRIVVRRATPDEKEAFGG